MRNSFFPHWDSPSGISFDTISSDEAEKEWQRLKKWAALQQPQQTVQWHLHPHSGEGPTLLMAEWSPLYGEVRPNSPLIRLPNLKFTIAVGSIVDCTAPVAGFYGERVRIDSVLQSGMLECTKPSTNETITLMSNQISHG